MQVNGESELERITAGKDLSSGHGGFLCRVPEEIRTLLQFLGLGMELNVDQ